MQAMLKSRRWADSDGNQGGPGGIVAPGPNETELNADQAETIRDLYLRGAASRMVAAQKYRIATITTLRGAGLIETGQDVRGRTEAKLTARGLSCVPQANAQANAPAL